MSHPFSFLYLYLSKISIGGVKTPSFWQQCKKCRACFPDAMTNSTIITSNQILHLNSLVEKNIRSTSLRHLLTGNLNAAIIKLKPPIITILQK